MGEPLVAIGNLNFNVGETLILAAAFILAGLIVIAVTLLQSARAHAFDAARHGVRAEDIEHRMAELTHIQAETAGRLHAMGEVLAGRQTEFARSVGERLDSVSHRLGQSMEAASRQTVESLRHLYERISVIDHAQKNIAELGAQVTNLRDVLGNKQARGAFGQARMEAIVQDGLPIGAYAFQYTLSNAKRPDCVVFLPTDERPLVIDAKFPLEAVTAYRSAANEDEKKAAGQRLRHDIHRHVTDIAERYLIAGETQDLALMFVPSESVFADLHDGFDDVIQKAYRAQVVLVSPSLLMLAIQVMQQILKDSRMREAAHTIRAEVGYLGDDLGRLRERVLNLQRHFGQASDDLNQILVSADRIARRAGRIEALEFDGEETPREARTAIPVPLTQKLAAGA
ncbi:MAG: DNA recombination protein RmuC [Proteobacteria bacterium]|nr:DNA recombination protein RmuC [Pseudomonadota bacterium]